MMNDPLSLKIGINTDEHNFPPQIVLKCWYFNYDSISTMEW